MRLSFALKCILTVNCLLTSHTQVSCVFFKNRIKTYAVLHGFPNTSNLVYHSPVLEIEKQQNPAKQKNPHCYLEPFDLFIHYTHSLQLPVYTYLLLCCKNACMRFSIFCASPTWNSRDFINGVLKLYSEVFSCLHTNATMCSY